MGLGLCSFITSSCEMHFYMDMCNWLRCLVQCYGFQDVSLVDMNLQLDNDLNVRNGTFMFTRYSGLFISSSLALFSFFGVVLALTYRMI